jgi:hypothetical protein
MGGLPTFSTGIFTFARCSTGKILNIFKTVNFIPLKFLKYIWEALDEISPNMHQKPIIRCIQGMQRVIEVANLFQGISCSGMDELSSILKFRLILD